jgi:hypothetical protein
MDKRKFDIGPWNAWMDISCAIALPVLIVWGLGGWAIGAL